MGMDDDTFLVVASHSSCKDAETVASLSRGIRDAAMPVVAETRRMHEKYDCALRALRLHFSASKRSALEATGLSRAIEKFLCESDLSVQTVLRLQEIATTPRSEMREIPLTEYTTQSGNVISITVGSILDAMKHDPICVYFQGCAYRLQIYFRANGGQLFLPVCKEGRFFSWGYANRIGSVGNFQDAAYLSVDGVEGEFPDI
jgi:hypothetical protein